MVTETITYNKDIEKYLAKNNYQSKDSYHEDSWHEYIQILDLLGINNPEEENDINNAAIKVLVVGALTACIIILLIWICIIVGEPILISIFKTIFLSCGCATILSLIIMNYELNIDNTCSYYKESLNEVKTKLNNMNLNKYVNLDYELLNPNQIKEHVNYNNLNFIEKLYKNFQIVQVNCKTKKATQFVMAMMNKNQSFNVKNLQQIQTLIKAKQKFDELGLPNHYFDNYINNTINSNKLIYQNDINELISSFNKIKVNIKKDNLLKFKQNQSTVFKINTIIDNNKKFEQIMVKNPNIHIEKIIQEECDKIINQNNANHTLKDVLDEIIKTQDLIMNKIANQIINNHKEIINVN